ncbi:MAG: GNAT family N-acetyltransferase [Asticcacaulis sp.]
MITSDILSPDALTDEHKQCWASWQRSNPELTSPFFDFRFFQAAARTVPGARVAMFHDRGRPVAFLPFQRRGQLIQPLGAPLCDYHGLIAAPETSVDLKQMLRRAHAGVMRFGSWVGPVQNAVPVAMHERLAILMPDGFAPWLAGQHKRHHKFYKNLGRCERGAERDLGPLRLVMDANCSSDRNWIIAQKQAQYRRTRRHDVFQCGWTGALLDQLSLGASPEFGLRTFVLYAGETRLAAEMVLQNGREVHRWFPAYDPQYHRYSPGVLLLSAMLKHLETEGVTHVDFGSGDEPYKRYMADPVGVVHEGRAETCLLHLAVSHGLDWLETRVPQQQARVLAFRNSLRRRVDVISGCETRLDGWVRASAVAALGLAGKFSTLSHPTG